MFYLYLYFVFYSLAPCEGPLKQRLDWSRLTSAKQHRLRRCRRRVHRYLTHFAGKSSDVIATRLVLCYNITLSFVDSPPRCIKNDAEFLFKHGMVTPWNYQVYLLTCVMRSWTKSQSDLSLLVINRTAIWFKLLLSYSLLRRSVKT